MALMSAAIVGEFLPLLEAPVSKLGEVVGRNDERKGENRDESRLVRPGCCLPLKQGLMGKVVEWEDAYLYLEKHLKSCAWVSE